MPVEPSHRRLRPGFAFGGPCLPKDIAALVHRAGALGLDLPLTASILPANRHQVARAIERVRAVGRRRVSLLGLAFKPETGEHAGSPFLALAQGLIDGGFDLRVFDPHVDFADFAGAPGGDDGSLAARAARSLEEALAHGETIVLGTRHGAFAGLGAMLKPSQVLVEIG